MRVHSPQPARPSGRAVRWPSVALAAALASATSFAACAREESAPAADGPGAATASDEAAPRLFDRRMVAPDLIRLASEAADAADSGGAAEWLELAMLYDANQIEEFAARAYARALALDDSALTAYHLGRMHEVLGDGEAALEALDHSIRLDDTYAPSHWRRGEMLLALGRLDEAEPAFRGALALAPELTPALNGLARLQLVRGEPEAAIETLENVDERDRTANGILARAYRQVGRNGRADRALEREQRTETRPARDPWTAVVQLKAVGPIVILEKAGNAVNAGEHRLALELLQPLYERDPGELGVLDLLTRALLLEERWNDVIGLVEHAPRRLRNHFRLQLTYGRALTGVGRAEEALPYLARAVELNEHFSEGHVALGEAFLRLERLDEAEAAFERALRAGRDSVRDWALLARTRIQLERYAEAEATLDEALEIYPHSSILLSNLADAQVRAGKLDEARDSIAQAAERDPGNELIEPVRRRIRAREGSPTNE